jgi:hypothetical protein
LYSDEQKRGASCITTHLLFVFLLSNKNIEA